MPTRRTAGVPASQGYDEIIRKAQLRRNATATTCSLPEAVIAGLLRGDRRSVTYAAQTIRLGGFLRRRAYRRSLNASLLLAWNFETLDRARASVLAALVDAKVRRPREYQDVVNDLDELR